MILKIVGKFPRSELFHLCNVSLNSFNAKLSSSFCFQQFSVLPHSGVYPFYFHWHSFWLPILFIARFFLHMRFISILFTCICSFFSIIHLFISFFYVWWMYILRLFWPMNVLILVLVLVVADWRLKWILLV